MASPNNSINQCWEQICADIRYLSRQSQDGAQTEITE